MFYLSSNRLRGFVSGLLIFVLVILLCVPFSDVGASQSNSQPAPAATPATSRNAAHRANQLLIRFRDGISEQEKQRVVASEGARGKGRLRGRSAIEKLELSNGQDLESVAAQLRAHPEVELVEPNYLIAKSDIIPNDPRFEEQWALRNSGNSGGRSGSDIGAVSAWDVTTGASETIIAVIDSGIDFTHPELRRNIWINRNERLNGRDDDGNGLVDDRFGWDWITGDSLVKDEQGHGTAVAGVIAAQGNNAVGISGVMWRAGLMSLRVLDNTGTGDVASAIEAIDYAVAQGAQIINCSWGTDAPSAALRDALERAGSHGVLVVSSAGNAGRNLDQEPYYPAAFNLPNLISVASTDSNDNLATWSNHGNTYVNVAAPGVSVLTTKMGGGFQTVSGTSISAPLVSGVAGLIRTLRPYLNANRTKEMILNGVRVTGALAGNVSSGGVVNATGALGGLNTLMPGEGIKVEAGINGGNHDPSSNGNGQGNGGANSIGGANGNGGNSGPPPTPGKPGPDLPDLDVARQLRPDAPKAPALISSNICYECDPTFNEPPVAEPGGPYAAQSGQSIQFNGSGSWDSDGWITTYTWNFGDGTSGTGMSPSHTYANAGTYTVTLTVKDNQNALDSTSTTATIVSLPSPWVQQDIGSVGYAGGASYSSGTFSVQGSGSDIWDYDDAFHYVNQTLNGDGQIVARVASVGNTDQWAKVGVMIREGMNSNARQVSMFVSSAVGTAFQWRATPGLNSNHIGSSGAAPYWVKLVRSGNNFSGFKSPDGVNWEWVGSTTIYMGTSVYIGMAVTAHNNSAVCTGTFTNVAVSSIAQAHAARYIVQSVPTSMTAGKSYNVSVTMRNTGTKTWTVAGQHRLGSQNPQDNLTWGVGRTDVTTSVGPGGFATFNFLITAPSTPGTYNFQRRMLQESVEWFGDYTPNVVVNVSAATSIAPSNVSAARLDPANRTGESGPDAISRNINWSLPLLTLRGRAGLDLGLAITYNSLVWTKVGSTMIFDADRGLPSPGFRVGLPIIQPRFYNDPAGVYSYLLITSTGARIELRQIGATNIYDSVDATNLRLTDNGATMVLRIPDGTQMTYSLRNGQYYCAEIKDHNGNYITANYNVNGRLDSITDTLSRNINFTYDTNNYLTSISQVRGGVSQSWVTFGYSNLTVQTSFPGLTVSGPQNGQSLVILKQVGLADGSRVEFDYNTWGQVNVFRRYAADGHQRAYISFNLPPNSGTPQYDCPRFTEQRTWAQNWNGDNDGSPTTAEEAVTTYSNFDFNSGVTQITTPDGVIYKVFYGTSGWQRGLVTQTETWSSGIRKKWTSTEWTQDNVGVGYPVNPRPVDSSSGDPEGNRRRTTISYTSYNLPSEVIEYGNDGTTVLRRTQTDFNLDSVYLNNRIIGLVREQRVYDGGGALVSKVDYQYDWTGEFLQNQGTAVQHDSANFSTAFVGRGNVVSMRRWNVFSSSDAAQAVEYRTAYNTHGSVIFTRDPLGHQTTIGYTDAFSDGVNRNTFAYPSVQTNADNFSEYHQFNYDLGLLSRMQDPKGAVQTFTYDAAGRIDRITNVTTQAYKRWVYPTAGYIQTFTAIVAGAPEAYSVVVFDGDGRVRATAGDMPNTTGTYSGQFTYYDVMGRASQRTNPAEMNGAWTPAGDDSAGWIWSYHEYDWKSRPTITRNPDGTTREATYEGCGCAGGSVTTLRDEVNRRQRIVRDELGRIIRSETLNADGSVYRAVVNTYNARDQLTNIYDQVGNSSVGQQTVKTYDGHGRLATHQDPQQTVPTTYSYNADDTVSQISDPRGATSTYVYNGRHQAIAINFGVPTGVAATSNVSFAYDQAGNRTSMTDGLGSASYTYNTASQLTSETRTFTNVGSYTLNYAYNMSGELSSITDHFGANVTYSYDHTGRVITVGGSGYAGVSQYASLLRYRAWGGLKGMTYGNNFTVAVNYDNRMRIQRFEVAGRNAQFGGSTVMLSDHQYYADGNLRYSHDQLDERFDRAFNYNLAGQLTEAYSGSEARDFINNTNSGSATGPFRQSYQYDVWNHIVNRNNRFWSQSDSTAMSYTNNRNNSWQYDAAGDVLTDSDMRYVYDAAQRNRSAESLSGSDRITQWHDGDGQVVKREEVHPNTTTTTNYIVRSSVLGGKVIMELNSTGQKQCGYVYAGGQLLAKQENNAVSWKHNNPVTGSRGESYSDGSYAPLAEPDSLGVNVGFEDPYIFFESGPPPEPQMPMLFAGFDIPDGSCLLDGIAISCSMVGSLLQSGAAVIAPAETTRWNPTLNNGRGGFEFFRAYADGFSGFLPNGAIYDGGGRWYIPGDPDDEGRNRRIRPENGQYGFSQTRDYLIIDPQRRRTPQTVDPITKIRKNFKDFLKNLSDACKEALKDYIDDMAKAIDTVPIFNIDKMQNADATKYIGETMNVTRGTETRTLNFKGKTLSEAWDMIGVADAMTIFGGGAPQLGIYVRWIETFEDVGGTTQGSYSLLHEMAHWVSKMDDDALAKQLGVKVGEGETSSTALSRFFESGCTQKEPNKQE